MDCSLPGSYVHGILQARILEWVAITSSRGSSGTGVEPESPTLAGGFFPTATPGKPIPKSTIFKTTQTKSHQTHWKGTREHDVYIGKGGDKRNMQLP